MKLNIDIIELNDNINGEKRTDNLTYFCAYKFKDGVSEEEVKKFCDDFKNISEDIHYLYSDEMFDFVEDGVFRLDRYKRLEKFKVLIEARPMFYEKRAVLDDVKIQIVDYSSTSFILFEFLKELVEKASSDDYKFDCLRDERIYENLKAGTEVLVCDDFITSAAILSEIEGFIKSVNPDNKLTAFSFINHI